MHRMDLIKKGYKGIDKCSGTTRLKKRAEIMKATRKIKSYRIVPYKKGYELYVKR